MVNVLEQCKGDRMVSDHTHFLCRSCKPHPFIVCKFIIPKPRGIPPSACSGTPKNKDCKRQSHWGWELGMLEVCIWTQRYLLHKRVRMWEHVYFTWNLFLCCYWWIAIDVIGMLWVSILLLNGSFLTLLICRALSKPFAGASLSPRYLPCLMTTGWLVGTPPPTSHPMRDQTTEVPHPQAQCCSMTGVWIRTIPTLNPWPPTAF